MTMPLDPVTAFQRAFSGPDDSPADTFDHGTADNSNPDAAPSPAQGGPPPSPPWQPPGADLTDALAGCMPSPADAPELYQTIIIAAPPPPPAGAAPAVPGVGPVVTTNADGTVTVTSQANVLAGNGQSVTYPNQSAAQPSIDADTTAGTPGTPPGSAAPAPFAPTEADGSPLPTVWSFPAHRRQGVCVVTIKRSLKKEDQKTAGRKKAKTKVTGTNSNKGEILFRYSSKIFSETEAMLMDIDPNGPYGGGPFSSAHPEFVLSRTSAFMIDEVGDRTNVSGSPYLYERKVTISEWVPPAPAVGAGGVTTPPAADAPPPGAPGSGGVPTGQVNAAPQYGGKGSPDAAP